MLLVASQTSCHEEDGVVVVAFETVPEESGGETYLVLQRTLEPNDEDARLGMDVAHLEVSDQARGDYGLIEKAELWSEGLRIILNSEGQTMFRAEEIEVRFGKVDRHGLESALEAVLRDVEFHRAAV